VSRGVNSRETSNGLNRRFAAILDGVKIETFKARRVEVSKYSLPHEAEFEPYEASYEREQVSAVRRECDAAMQAAGDQAAELLEGARQAFCRFAREKPEVTALTCLGIGFLLGWKLKPW
jgi:hypothetical protein